MHLAVNPPLGGAGSMAYLQTLWNQIGDLSRRRTSGSSESASSTPSRRLRRRFVLALLAGVSCSGMAGCSTLSGMRGKATDTECLDEFMISHRNEVMAKKAWFRIADCHRNHPCWKDLREGFIAGYMEVATGGSGCTPAVISSDYWGWRYQCAQGQCSINAWFEGFPLGVKAAEEDGIGYYNQIRLNSRLPYIPSTAMNGSMAPTPAPAPPIPTALPPGVELQPGETLVPGKLQIEDLEAGELAEPDAAAIPAVEPLLDPVGSATESIEPLLPGDKTRDDVDPFSYSTPPVDDDRFRELVSEPGPPVETSTPVGDPTPSKPVEMPIPETPSQSEIDSVIEEIFGRPSAIIEATKP
ncbi:MAG: hypothetical protein AAGJ40_10165 [Planctomycetota bacterium]